MFNLLRLARLLALWLGPWLGGAAAFAQTPPTVVDIPTRSALSAPVTQRFLYAAPAQPKAAVILLAGGHGGLQIQNNGTLAWGNNNFLVRTRQQFLDAGLAVALLDAPSDRQSPPFLSGYRQTPAHASDIQAVIAWLRAQAPLASRPVWLVGTSRGTQSAAYAATALAAAPIGPDGLVLTSTLLSDPRSRPVPDMPLQRLRIPVVVLHHAQDGCLHCAPTDLPRLMDQLALATAAPPASLVMLSGGQSTGDVCEASSHHGFLGVEAEAVRQITTRMQAAIP